MRPAGRGELDSLYFSYPQFDPPADRAHLSDPVPVAIVGAGPVGMTAALTLARHGQRSVIFERKRTFNDGSRAICISRSSMQTLARLGAVGPFLDKALPWTTGRSFYRGRQILEFHMPAPEGETFAPMYNLQQQYIEAFLHRAAEASPLIEIRWGSEVAGLEETGSGLRLEVCDPAGAYSVEADFLLAADGARSAVRRVRGLRLNGENYEGRYVIADVQMPHDYPTIRRALFDPASRPGGTVLIHRQPDDIWRIDYQLRAGEDETEAMREDVVRESVAGVLRDIAYDGPWDLEWWSVYSANTLALDDYRDGRIFFIGDSAHIVPIFGVRGLNNGIADGENIGWKLAWVLSGRAGDGLLDSYTPERRGATLDVFAQASKSTRFMTPPTRGYAILRDAALSLALTQPWAGELANPRQMTPYRYSAAPWTRPDGTSDPFAPGNVLPDMALGKGHLHDRLGSGFTLVCFGAEEEFPDLDGLETLRVPEGPCPPGICLLVRPDAYVLARWTSPQASDVQMALAAALDMPSEERERP